MTRVVENLHRNENGDLAWVLDDGFGAVMELYVVDDPRDPAAIGARIVDTQTGLEMLHVLWRPAMDAPTPKLHPMARKARDKIAELDKAIKEWREFVNVQEERLRPTRRWEMVRGKYKWVTRNAEVDPYSDLGREMREAALDVRRQIAEAEAESGRLYATYEDEFTEYDDAVKEVESAESIIPGAVKARDGREVLKELVRHEPEVARYFTA